MKRYINYINQNLPFKSCTYIENITQNQEKLKCLASAANLNIYLDHYPRCLEELHLEKNHCTGKQENRYHVFSDEETKLSWE